MKKFLESSFKYNKLSPSHDKRHWYLEGTGGVGGSGGLGSEGSEGSEEKLS